MSSNAVRHVTIAACLAVTLTAVDARAEEAAPQTVSEFAKSVQERMQSVRKPGEKDKPPFPFGHFLKPPPPPPIETEDGQPVVAIVLPPEIKCQGTMNMGGSTVVVMSDGTHRVGDVVLGARITAITASEVTFNFRGKLFKLPVR